MSALEFQERVVTAAVSVRIAAADIGPRLVHGAAPLLGIEEAADGLVDVVALVPQDLLVHFLGLVAISELLPGLAHRQAEVTRQALDVVVAHGNARVTAAIA